VDNVQELQHKNGSVELFQRDRFRMALSGRKGNHAMLRKQMRKDNLIDLATSRRERRVELGRTDRTPKRSCSYLDEAADVETSALDQLLSLLDGRRGH
jgi:hypothetical protein